MGIFAIFNTTDAEKTRAAIKKELPNDFLELVDGQWLVSSAGTAKDVSDRLKVSNGESGSAIVISMGGYYGRASSNIWDWIKAKAEEPNG